MNTTSANQQTVPIGRAADWRLGAGLLLILGLLAFEIFNFDTSQYALGNLMGDVSFAGLRWATVLAIAFCAIDFAGLLRILAPQPADKRETWYLMGAWLLAATMNAIMTWWAVTLTLLNHDLGNEVLTRAQLVNTVPIFIAVLVWLTRILFIGALTVAGDHLFQRQNQQAGMAARRQPAATMSARAAQPVTATAVPPTRRPIRKPTQQPIRASQPARRQPAAMPAEELSYEELDQPVMETPSQPPVQPQRPSRINRRPPLPNRQPVPMTAKGRNR